MTAGLGLLSDVAQALPHPAVSALTVLSALHLNQSLITVEEFQDIAAAARDAFTVAGALHPTAFDWPKSAKLENESCFDFIIAGGGVSGSILANRLTESGEYSVLLIEAGDDPQLEATIPATIPFILHSKADWDYSTQDKGLLTKYHAKDGIYYPSGKMLGGNGPIFLHFHTRADPEFYDGWAAALNDSSWSYDSILPYFKKSEHVKDEEIMRSEYASSHGTDGPIGLSRIVFKENENYLNAFAELGNKILLDKVGKDNVGYFNPLYESVDKTLQNPGKVYLSPIKNRKNLYVLKNTLATKIIFNENKVATSIEVLDSKSEKWIYKADKEIIASTGAFKTPQLLMLSGVGPKDQLDSFGIDVVADLPVGQSYHDLFGATLVHQMDADNPIKGLVPLLPPFSNGPIIVGFSALNKSQTTIPDYMTENYILPAGGILVAGFCSLYLNFNNHICQQYLDAQATHNVLLTLLAKLDPKSNGKILLKSTDPKDPPLIYGGFLNNAEDQADLVKYLKDYTNVINTDYFRKTGAKFIKPDLPECDCYDLYTDDYWNCYIPRMFNTIFKYMSSCPMGKVVDTQLKVKGVQKLRVVDASVFPSATRAHPMATVVMVAEKAADMILGDWA